MRKILVFIFALFALSAFAQRTILNITLGETVADYQFVYIKVADGKAYLADPTDAAKSPAIGVCLVGGVLNDVTQAQLDGIIEVVGAGYDVGATYYLDNASPGDITATPPTYKQVAGVAISSEYFVIAGAASVVAPGGAGTVTDVSVTNANGVSGSVATSTTTPAITLSLGNITPTTVNGIALSGSSTPTLAVTGTTAVSGTNTGDQSTIVGITGTKAQFSTAVTDGDILYVGDVTTFTDEAAQDATGAMVTDGSLVYVDGTPLLTRGALSGDVTASQGSNTVAVTKINGTSLSGLATGILKNTTTTGVPSIAVAGDFPTLNQNTTGTAASFTGSLAGDVTGTQAATVVGKINGVSMSGLTTGILKNTTTTGVPSIAIAADFPTLNQNTTGSAATLTTPRAINGTSFDGSAAITVTAAAGTLTGATLNSGVTASSLTSVGTIATGVWNGTAVPVTNGGTGSTSANAALNALLPTQGSSTGKYLQTDGTNTSWATAGGTGTVTTLSVTTANGVSGSVATATTTPAITLSLGAITPTSVNGVTVSGSSTPTLSVVGTSAITGTNTGDNSANSLYSGLVSNATHTGDATGSTALTVVKINGTSLAGLGTGLLKNTTGTGVPSIAINSDLPVMTATVGGAVPTPPNNTTTFLRGDGTFAAPSGGGSGDITNGGNTTGAAVTIGTNDAFGLNLETNNVTRASWTGAASTGGALTLTDVTATTAAVEDVATVQANSTGTAAASFGPRIKFQGESTTTDNQDMGGIGAIWTTATHASRTSSDVFYGVNNAGALGEFARFEGATAPVLKIASAVGTAGTTTYGNAGITTGVSFTVGNSSSILTLGGNSSTGAVGLSTGKTATGGAITIRAIDSGSSVLMDRSSSNATSGTMKEWEANGFVSPTSGTATYTLLLNGKTFNQTGGANGITAFIKDNPTLTSVADYRSFQTDVNNANAKGIYQTGAITTNNLVGKTTFGATTTPTAFVQIAAGTATVAPLLLTSGTNLTTAVAGGIEFDGTEFYGSNSSTRTILARVLKGSSTLDFGATAPGTSTDLPLTVTGAAVGDPVALGVDNSTTATTNGSWSAWVSATNTVTIRFANSDLVSTINPASATFKVSVIK